MTDPIADMLTRIRNAQAVKKTEVVLPFSNFKHSLGRLLVEEGWLAGIEKVKNGEKGAFDELRVKLKYNKSGKPAIIKLIKISKPGRRVYVNYQNLPYVLNNLGIAVISTSRGLMTNKRARREKVGGEILCEIY
ncbi:30S ribosomal protein S8 [Candidatus Falkowbacteria bacterium CG10_big_fil_rev_8_21_14_0_10_43_10]|uniref:Small ribosomal subunit protein uS8 n=1 Tax=Candidatus Falkowbacteria bacterium CG10_big_fil_rev_8_21_14_0_10_43_10 TaxID=1974567 RepID=A0A2H0V2M8_9BACT|nr:MAG: 30S ribosomal protein S8 [Candidatus Falkowbacteria bacterium CG10_big_fil_rev_8_21_14_0_10_43_10]